MPIDHVNVRCTDLEKPGRFLKKLPDWSWVIVRIFCFPDTGCTMRKAKRMLFTGDKIDGLEAERLGLVLKAVPPEALDNEVEALAERMASVPVNQLMIQKMVVNQAIKAMGLANTQRLATILDGITRHSPEGLNFKNRAEAVGWKQAVDERDRGTYDWTRDQPINRPQ